MRAFVTLLAISLCCPLTVLAQSTSATVICKKNSNGVLTLRSKRCKSGETKVTNISSLTGATGAQGTSGSPGADGSLRIYGDSSAGALSVSGGVTWNSTEALGQYTDCSIAAGATLTVPTGTVLRCSGSFTNNGTITVATPYTSAQIGGIPAAGGQYPSYLGSSAPGLGWGRSAGSNGGYGSDAAMVSGGPGGFSLQTRFAANILRPGPIGGGSGGAPVGSFGAAGGGTLTVLAQGALVNNGTIRADGSNAGGVTGAGGGGGGIIILASKVSVSNEAAGALEADGGAGGDSDIYRGSGGGGGGGLIHILAPTINVVGSTSVLGGAAGSSATNVTNSPRSGGGGGGSMVGAGGAGGNVQTGDSVTGTGAGTAGIVIQTLTDPTSLF